MAGPVPEETEESYPLPWTAPTREGKFMTGLKVNNSMAGGRVDFVPIASEGSRRVTWYACGPTVYDSAHMGHARTYVAFDVLRRLMNDYLGYDVRMCMNVTDIDDKIIKRSQEAGQEFTAWARKWEAAFWEDMRKLNVLLPDVITRVSEYIPEVLDFIAKIIANGFGYESQGSVYFDTQAFINSKKHTYGRMEPSSVADQSKVLEGEGDLGIVTEKRCPLDFALWKKSKPGEPSWDSPWGQGRPGWHIECSAMACSVLGFPMDIHSGGIDLRFPHHDNELAQSEACYDKPQWVNYFLHSGHLNIKGSKMSKSLKNFETIGEALERYSPREIRLLTITHRWDAPMDYSRDGEAMSQASEIDRTFRNFFERINATLRDVFQIEEANVASHSGLMGCQKWNLKELKVDEVVSQTKRKVHEAILDNFNTPEVVNSLRTLVGEVNTYLHDTPKSEVRGPLIFKAARYVFSILRVMGVVKGSDDDMAYVEQEDSAAAIQGEARVMSCLADFRKTVRLSAQGLMKLTKAKGTAVVPEEVGTRADEVLTACDAVRDEQLVELGILLEDTNDGPVWKKSSKQEILRLRARRLEEEVQKKQQKLEQQRLLEEAKAKKEAEAKVAPSDYYRTLRGMEYAGFDADGVPMMNKDGTPVSKSQRDKMTKFLEKHRKVHEQYLAKTKSS